MTKKTALRKLNEIFNKKEKPIMVIQEIVPKNKRCKHSGCKQPIYHESKNHCFFHHNMLTFYEKAGKTYKYGWEGLNSLRENYYHSRDI